MRSGRYSRRLQAGTSRGLTALLLLGDQVYADEVSPETASTSARGEIRR